MSSKPVWNFRPSEQAADIVSRIEENVQTVNSRSEAINLLLQLQGELVESGGMDMIFSMMSMDEPVVVAESEREQMKEAVKEAIVELEDGSADDTGNTQ